MTITDHDSIKPGKFYWVRLAHDDTDPPTVARYEGDGWWNALGYDDLETHSLTILAPVAPLELPREQKP